MKKRLIAMLLVLIMAMCIFPISAFAKSPSSLDTMQTRTVDYSFYDYYTGKYISVPSSTICSQGSYGIYVKAVQMAVREVGEYRQIANTAINVDSSYGSLTATAVSSYQQYKRNLGYTISVDGDVGPQTWPYLAGDYGLLYP